MFICLFLCCELPSPVFHSSAVLQIRTCQRMLFFLYCLAEREWTIGSPSQRCLFPPHFRLISFHSSSDTHLPLMKQCKVHVTGFQACVCFLVATSFLIYLQWKLIWLPYLCNPLTTSSVKVSCQSSTRSTSKECRTQLHHDGSLKSCNSQVLLCWVLLDIRKRIVLF
jgi:hypothetical protein